MEAWRALIGIVHAALGMKERSMARLMRVSPPNSALRVGSSELSSVLEQEVVKMQWCILYELWRKKQSMMVNWKLRAIGKKEGVSVCHSRGACACAGRGCTALS